MTQKELRDRLAQIPIEEAAPMLLGARLIGPDAEAAIVEVESYGGEDDAGSHAWRGPTPRTRIMYGQPGFAFVYFTYGNHWMLNMVGREEGRAGAILIRGAMPVSGIENMRQRRLKARTDEDLLSGPGKIAAAFGLSGEHNGLDLLDSESPLQVIPGDAPGEYWTGVRVGLSPQRGAETPWRFIDLRRARWASRPRPAPL